MTSRVLGLALMISLGVHVVVMSAIGIVSYEGPGRTKPYTRIDFLGPILGKTAFDMMVGRVVRMTPITPGAEGSLVEEEDLAVTAKDKVRPLAEPGPHEEEALDVSAAASLSGWKAVPEAKVRAQEEARSALKMKGPEDTGAMARKVIFRPDTPYFIKGQYGEKDSFRIKVKALLDAEGNVIKAEPLTTTGYPQLDMSAAKFVKSWTYEPSKALSRAEEWVEEEVVLKAGE